MANIFKRLKRLFSTGVIIRHVGGKKLKVMDTDSVQSYLSNAYRDRYSRIFSTAYYGNTWGNQYGLNMAYQTQRIMLFREYDIMDSDPILHCIFGNTEVMTLKGPISIQELTKLYPNGENFEVWSWDKEKCQYTIGQAHHPRKTAIKEVIEIVLDNGKILKCTDNHRLMLIDGSYREAGNCKVGDALMPFSYKTTKDGKYIKIRKSTGGYTPAHRYIFENVLEEDVQGKHIHHINHNTRDNRVCNLQIMTPEEHIAYHGKSPITKGKRSDATKKLWKDSAYRKKVINAIKIWQTSEDGHNCLVNQATLLGKKTKERWKNDRKYANRTKKIFSDHLKSLWANPDWSRWKREQQSKIAKNRYENDAEFRKLLQRSGKENGRYNHNISTQSILIKGFEYSTLVEFANDPLFKNVFSKNKRGICQFINNRLKEAGFSGWKNYKQTYQYTNHKITEIRRNGEVADVFDLTVDRFENFAINQGIIISNSALDIYADECTVHNENHEILTIECDDDNIKDILENLFYDILNIEFNLYSWVRNMCKYGDQFLFIEINEEYGVTNIYPLSVYDTVRVENEDPDNPRYVYFQTMGMSGQKVKMEQYEVMHLRLMTDSNFLPYGKSMMEGARRTWKQLTLMEDAMLIHRIMRAPEKRVIKVDIGNTPPNEVDAFMQKMADKMKKTPFMDPATGDYNLRYNMMNIIEDFYLPVRSKNDATEITNLGGLEFNSIEDIEYLRNRMMAALKIPKSFLGYEEAVGGKLTLAAEDVRFARTIERIQKIIVAELKKLAIVHLFCQGFEDEELVSFNLHLTLPSTIYEQEKLNIWKERVQFATDAQNLQLVSSEWIYKHMFNFSDTEVEEQRRLVVEDTKRKYRLAQLEQGASDPAKYGYPQDQEPQEPAEGAPAEGEEQPVGEAKIGRPKTGMQYGQDSHPEGRDPIGLDGRYDVIKHSKQDIRIPRKKSPLSLEIAGLKTFLGKKFNKPPEVSSELLSENTKTDEEKDKGTFLDKEIVEDYYVDSE